MMSYPGKIALLLLIAGSVSLRGADAPPVGPRGEVVQPVFDAGVVLSSLPVRHTFTIKNSGDAPLTIKEVKPECSCTVPEFTRTPILPGQEGIITLEATPGTQGPAVRAAEVITDPPANPSLVIRLKFTGVVLLAANPGRLLVRNFVAGIPSVSQEVVVKALQPLLPMETPVAVTDRAYLTARVRVIEAGREYGVTLHSTGDLKAGEVIEGNIRLKTGLAEQPEFLIPYSGTILNRVRTLPDTVQFGTIPRMELRKATGSYDVTVVVDNPGGGGAKFTLGKITTPEAQVRHIDTLSLAEGQRYVLKFRVNPALPVGPFSGKLVIATSDPQLKQVELPFSGTME